MSFEPDACVNEKRDGKEYGMMSPLGTLVGGHNTTGSHSSSTSYAFITPYPHHHHHSLIGGTTVVPTQNPTLIAHIGFLPQPPCTLRRERDGGNSSTSPTHPHRLQHQLRHHVQRPLQITLSLFAYNCLNKNVNI